MRDMQPITRPLNLTAQDCFTYGSWGLTIVLLIVAVAMSRREKSPFYLLVVLAAMVAAFGEPIYDNLMVLYFYTAHNGHSALQTHFTAFGVPQPVWTHSGYALLYAAPTLYITRKIHLGTFTKSTLYKVAVVSLLESCAFEIIGVNSGAYTYWGPHVLRIANYPLVIGMLEMAQVMCFAIAAAELRKRVTHPAQLLGLFVVFPCTFCLANYGGGMALIVGLHVANPSEFVRYATTLVSMGCALGLVRLAAAFVPAKVPQTAVVAEPARPVGSSGAVAVAR